MGGFMASEKAMSFQYEVKRRPRRRSVGIQISREGKVYVLAPLGIRLSEIETMVKSRSEWVEKHLYRLKEKQNTVVEKHFEEGEAYFYLGKEYTLKFSASIEERVRLQDNEIIIWFSEKDSATRRQKAKLQLHAWYQKQAFAYLEERVRWFSNVMNLHPKGIQVKTVQTKWGSCNLKKILFFNWKLILVSAELIDYVVVHELAHLKHFNHSSAFWNEVEKIIPDYKIRRRQLRQMEWVL